MRPVVRCFGRYALKCTCRKTWRVLQSLTLLSFLISVLLMFSATFESSFDVPLVSYDVPLSSLKELKSFLPSFSSLFEMRMDHVVADFPPSPFPPAVAKDDKLIADEHLNFTGLASGCGEWLDTCASRCTREKVGIPRLVHFIKLDRQFSALHWFAILSAKLLIKPKQVILHIPQGLEMTGCWWQRTAKMVEIRRVQMHEVINDLNGVYVDHFAHKADFLRLSILYFIGGIYMDMDAVAVKPLDDLLLANHAVLSKLYNGRIGNGMMLAVPQSCLMCMFAQQSCSEYNGEWDRHSVEVISQLLEASHNLFPEALVLKHEVGFFPFSWQPEHLNALMVAPARMVNWSIHENYALHFYAYAFPQSLHKLLSDTLWLANNHSVAATALRRLLNINLWRTSYMPCAKADQVRLQAEAHEMANLAENDDDIWMENSQKDNGEGLQPFDWPEEESKRLGDGNHKQWQGIRIIPD